MNDMTDVLSTACDPSVKRQVLNRLRRASGQLESIISMVDGDGDCRAVITQLAAVSAAVRRAGYVIVASRMKEAFGLSLETDDTGAQQAMNEEELERLFMMLG